MAEKLFTEFPAVSTQQWDEVIVKDLKGADYEKKLVWRTMEGFNVRPYYRAENLSSLKHLQFVPGEYPFVRGTCGNNHWKIRQTVGTGEGVAEANKKALELLMKGVESINFCMGGKAITEAEFATLVKGIELPAVEINFSNCKGEAKNIISYLVKYVEKQGWEPESIKGSVDYDQLRRLTLKGAFCCDTPFENVKEVALAAAPLRRFRSVGVSAYVFHNAGSTIVQELGFALAMGNEYLAQLTGLGLTIGEAASKMKFTFAVSSNYFMEIAKFRAARMLWANIVSAYGEAKPKCATKMRVHAVTSKWNQTVYDPYVNMLRGTTEAMSAALAGVDSLEVTPFDASFQHPTDFSKRIARNVQLLLKEESYFDRVVDPAAGSYYIETLTASIAEEAWKLFKTVEEKGGYLEAFKAGFIQQILAETAQKRNMNIATRREILLGTNQYPNFTEQLDKKILDKMAEGSDCHCCSGKEEANKIAEPICQFRGAMAFEELRMKTERSGKRPQAFMLTFGNLAMARARAQFSSNFFAVAGFEVVDNNRFATIEEGVKAALAAKADIVIACSADDDYAEAVPQIAQQIGDKAIVVVAGDPASKDELEAKGITRFVNVKSNVLETLQQYQKELGI